MAYIARPSDFQTRIEPIRSANQATVPTQRAWYRKIFDAIFESRERQAEREIARLVRGRGDKLTDSLEREIDRRIQTGNWSPNR